MLDDLGNAEVMVGVEHLLQCRPSCQVIQEIEGSSGRPTARPAERRANDATGAPRLHHQPGDFLVVAFCIRGEGS